jgi:hypothetical protein
MKFALDYTVEVGDAAVDSTTLLRDIDRHRNDLQDLTQLSGAVAIILDGESQQLDYAEPLVRLVNQWALKVPWVLSGDTETLPLRNSEQCFAFMPAGEHVEVSFFNGTENEVEDYVLEPALVRVAQLAPEIIRLAERLVDLIKAVNPTFLETDEDSRDLGRSLEEARKAWRDHQRRRH